MNYLLTILICTSLISSEIQIIEPEALRISVSDEASRQGLIDYSVSTFGHILYADTVAVEVLVDSKNELGCTPLSHPTQASPQKFVWLLERGVCTFAAKAFNSQQSGAYAVLVYHDKENSDVKNIIPSGDSFYNHLKIPIILISRENGLKIKAQINSKKPVFITIDLEMVF